MKVDFTQQLMAAFEETAITKVFQKGEFILKEGAVERNLYWIETGAVRVFYLSEYEEQIVRLGYEGSLINSLSSFIKEAPSEFYIEALRKTTLKVMPKAQLLALVHENQDSLKGYIQLLETLVTQQIDREIDLLITSPTERLKRVLERSPNLFQQVPLKYIASYLRMKPETLSRIRNS
jgi:CRP/FNR family transcriptional regulator, anaerobic regulatory protein